MNQSGIAYHPEFADWMTWRTEKLSDDPDTQVAQTINRMRQNVIEDSRSAPILNEARRIQQTGTGDPISDTFWHVKNRVGFRRDEALAAPFSGFLNPQDQVVELLVRPRHLASMPGPLEDCDGFASYLPALLRSQGVSCNLVTVAADGREPGRFSHVYAACTDPNSGERVSLDASHGSYPGWECTQTGQVTRLKEWAIDGPEWGELLLIAGLLFVAAKIWGVL